MVMENDHPPKKELESREPSLEDLVRLCRELNRQGAKYVVVGGFAIRAAGFVRKTMDVDLIIATDLENEGRVYRALSKLPDNAVRELQPGETEKYLVIRVADEIMVDLMKSARGTDNKVTPTARGHASGNGNGNGIPGCQLCGRAPDWGP